MARWLLLLSIVWLVQLCRWPIFAGEIWDGGGSDNNWTTGQNWNADRFRRQVPPPNDGTADIRIAGTERRTPIVDVPYSINSLSFDSGIPSFIVGGLQELTIGAGSISNFSSSDQAIVAPIKLAAMQRWHAANGPLSIRDVNLNGFQVTLWPTRNITITGVISGNGVLRSEMEQSATVTITGPAGNTYTAPTLIIGGDWVLRKSSGMAIPGPLTIASPFSVVRLEADEQISHAPANTVFVGRGLLDLNGHTETIARLRLSDGNVTTGATGKLIVGESITMGDDSSTTHSSTITGNIDLGGGDKLISVGRNSALSLKGSISNGGVTFTDNGTTLLSGAPNTYTGPTVVDAGSRVNLAKAGTDGGIRGDLIVRGILQLGGDEQILASPGNEVFIHDGTLHFLAPVTETIQDLRLQGGSVAGAPGNLTVLGALDVSVADGRASLINPNLNLAGMRTFNVQGDPPTGGAGLTVAGKLSNGSVVKTGPGTLDLRDVANTYAGGTSLNEGTLAVRSDGSLGDPAGAIHFNGGVLSAGGFTMSRPINWGPRGGGFDVRPESSLTLATQSLSGPGALTKLGAGILTLVAPQSYTGGTTVMAGTLVGNTQSLQGNIVTETFGSVAFEQTTDGSYRGNVSGTGALAKFGTGTVTLAGNNTYTGPTLVFGGTLELDGGNAIGDLSDVTLFNMPGAGLDLDDSNETIGSLAGGGANGGNVRLGNGTLTTGANNTNRAYFGIISGTGGLTKIGTATFTLSGKNTYSGPTSIQAGAVRLGQDSALPTNAAVDIAAAAMLDLNNFDQVLGALSGVGQVVLGNGDLTVGGGDASRNFSGRIEGAGSLVKIGAGVVTLEGNNTYTGGTTVMAGRLRGPAGSGLQGNIVNQAIVEFAQTADGAYSGMLSGPGSLIKTGPGRTTLAAPATYTGTTTVFEGTLAIANTLNATPSPIEVQASGILEASGTVQRPISGAGQITATGNLVVGDLTSASGFNVNRLNVGNHSVVLQDADRAQIDGGTIGGGSLTTLQGLALSGGTFSGQGTINGAFVNSGMVAGPAAPQAISFTGPLSGAGSYTGNIRIIDSFSPGNSPAQVSIENVEFASGATLTMELAGATAGTEYDQLVIAGDARLGGSLNVVLLPGGTNDFLPKPGDRFDLLKGGRLLGMFEQVNLPRLDGGLLWSVAQSDSSLSISVAPEPSAEKVWNVDAEGNWSAAGNWTGGVPIAADARAMFGGIITQPRTITVDVPITVGRIDFDNANAYTIAGSSALTLDTSSGEAQINVNNGSHTVSAPVTLADDTQITVTPAASNLSITGTLTSTSRNLTKAGAGTLTVNNLRAQALAINGGTVATVPNGAAAGTSVLGSLTIAGANDAWTAKYDLANNDAIVQSTAAKKTADFSRLYNQLKQGFNNGTWNGLGITSATAAGNANADTGLALVDNSLLGYTDFSGQPVNADSILLKYTYYGDIDQNGQVDADDLTVFASNFGRPSGAIQVDGDIDFNGAVNADDLTVFANNFNKGVGNPLAAHDVQAVPEPASLALAGIAVAALAGMCIWRRWK